MDTEKTSMKSASLAEARRHESAARWVVASRAYLNALSSQPELREIALAGLKRCASRETSTHTSVALHLIGHTLCGHWPEVVEIIDTLAQPTEAPQHLSPSISQRWPHLNQRLRFVIEQQSTEIEQLGWVAVLYALDTLVQLQYLGDAMMMAREVLSEIDQGLHKALICYEAGRVGIQNQQLLSGTLLLIEASCLAPNLKADINQLIDHELVVWLSELASQAVSETPDLVTLLKSQDLYDELISLRIEELTQEELHHWVNEISLHHEEVSAHQGAIASLWLGLCLERLWRSKGAGSFSLISSAFLAFALVIEQADRQGSLYDHAFSRLLHLALSRRVQVTEEETRPNAPIDELEDDESTFDSKYSAHPPISEELIEEGEARLLIQLKEQKRYDLVLIFLKEKASASHLGDRERAKAYNALAQVSLTAKGGLKQAVMYAQLGATLDSREIKLSTLIKSARAESDWSALEPLLKIQLSLTGISGKRVMILRTIAQGQRQSGLWFSSYLTLIQAGAEELASLSQNKREGDTNAEAHTAPDQVSPLLMSFSEETERELVSLLKVKGAALAIGEELLLQERWDDLYRLLERLLMKGRVCAELLLRAVNEVNKNWRFAEALLGLYQESELWEEWFSLLLYAPKNTWPDDALDELISTGIERAELCKSTHRSALLKARAEHLTRLDTSPQEHIRAWEAYLKEHPADLNAIEHLEPYAIQAKDWETLASVYEAALPLRKTGKLRILERLFELYDLHLQRTERAVEIQKTILAIDPSDESAGAWLTLHFAAKNAWHEILKTCEQWTPKTATHPVWTESKVRAHLGLQELNHAHHWWTQLSQKSVKRLFINPLLTLAAEKREGKLVLDLIDEIERGDLLYFDDLEESLEERGQSEHDDIPPPLPSEHDFEAELIEEDENKSLGLAKNPTHDPIVDILSPDDIDLLRARALYLWIRPCDLMSATLAWEKLSRQSGNNPEVTLALVDLYGRLGKRKDLLDTLQFVEHGVDEVLNKKEALVLGALTLETRFEEYTEAFKCWLALYEHSQRDRERCLAAFWRLSDKDPELFNLVQELLKLRAEHSHSQVLATSTLLELGAKSGPLQSSRELCYKAISASTHDPRYGIEATEILLRLTIPLGRWEDTCAILSQSEHWRLLLLSAHFTECKLGNHQNALANYKKSLNALMKRYGEAIYPLYVEHITKHIQGSIERVESHIAITTQTNKTIVKSSTSQVEVSMSSHPKLSEARLQVEPKVKEPKVNIDEDRHLEKSTEESTILTGDQSPPPLADLSLIDQLAEQTFESNEILKADLRPSIPKELSDLEVNESTDEAALERNDKIDQDSIEHS